MRTEWRAALSQGQEIADTDRAAVEGAIEHYLGIQQEDAAFISLPTFPLGWTRCDFSAWWPR